MLRAPCMATAHEEHELSGLDRVTRETPLLDELTERRLVRRMMRGDRVALDALVRPHLRLVSSMAKHFQRHGVAWDDLISEGNLALVEAARHFDPSRGARFATCAAWWIRAYLQRFTLANRRVVSPPSSRNARRLIGNLRRVERELVQRYRAPVTTERLAKALRVTPAEIVEIECALGGHDVYLEARGDRPAIDIADPSPDPEERNAEAEEAAQRVHILDAAMATLDPREREIVERRHLKGHRLTLRATGARIGISRERVRQLEGRALSKIESRVRELRHVA